MFAIEKGMQLRWIYTKMPTLTLLKIREKVEILYKIAECYRFTIQ